MKISSQPRNIGLLAILIFFSSSTLFAQGDKVKMDKKDEAAEVLLNAFMDALLIEDFDQSAIETAKFTHKSNLNNDRDNLDEDLLRYSFKKAHENAQFYELPVKITRIQANKVTGIGHPSNDTYEAGEERKYFIAKKAGVAGLPAPVVVFFPKDGGAPSISYMGSL